MENEDIERPNSGGVGDKPEAATGESTLEETNDGGNTKGDIECPSSGGVDGPGPTQENVKEEANDGENNQGDDEIVVMPGNSEGAIDSHIIPTVDHAEFSYALVQVRNAAREGKISKDVLETPLSLKKVLEEVETNDDEIKKLLFGYETELAKKEALKRLKKECVFKLGSGITNRAEEILHSEYDDDGVIFVEIDDERQSEDMVHHIAVSHPRKAVFVAFRGSATPKDWKVDFTMKMVPVENPVKTEGSDDEVKLHRGFYDYLLQEREMKTSEERMSKLNAIFGTVSKLMKEHKGYELIITGHSLGAALSTICAFFAAAAADERGFPTPIKCINIGSPYVGGPGFRGAFESLEKERKVMLLRIVNDGDPIPRGPKHDIEVWGPCSLHPAVRYRHVGLCLKLYGEPSPWQYANPIYWMCLLKIAVLHSGRPSYVIRKGKQYGTFVQFWHDVWTDFSSLWVGMLLLFEGPKRAMKFHGPSLYRKRLHAIKGDLLNMRLEELYSKGKSGGVIMRGEPLEIRSKKEGSEE